MSKLIYSNNFLREFNQVDFVEEKSIVDAKQFEIIKINQNLLDVGFEKDFFYFCNESEDSFFNTILY